MSNVNVKRVKSSEIEFKDRLVSIQRVTKVTKGGRTFSFSAIVVVGNENGVVGYGLGKAKEVTAAIAKGIDDAKKNLIKVPILKGTIPHDQLGKYSCFSKDLDLDLLQFCEMKIFNKEKSNGLP